MKIELFCIVSYLCVFMTCEKNESVISDEPVTPPTSQPKEPRESISTSGTIDWNDESVIVRDNNMANIGNNDRNAITYGNGRYVTVEDSNSATCSTDGIDWAATSELNDLPGVCHRNGNFIAVGTGGNVYYLGDGAGWSTATIPGKGNLRAACYENGKFVVVGESGVIAYPTDGSNWTAKSVGSNDWNSAYYGNGKFVVVENDGGIAYSINGTNWITKNVGSNWRCGACYGNGRFVIVGTNGDVAYSIDRISWTATTISDAPIAMAVCCGDEKFVVVGRIWNASEYYIRTIYYFTDGINWISKTMGRGELHGICPAQQLLSTLLNLLKSAGLGSGFFITPLLIGKCPRVINNKWMLVSDIRELPRMYHESNIQYMTAG